MNWWRAHHGISNDAKLALVAHRAKAKKCEVGWIWITLLDRASQAEERGSVDGLDAEEISLASDIPVQKVEAILEIFRSKGMVSNENVLTSWSKRQPLREREDNDAADRKRRERAKSHHVTPSHTMSRPEEIEEIEEIRTEEKSQNPCAAGAAPEPALPLAPILLEKKRPQKIWFDEQHDRWYSGYWCHQSKAASRKAFEKRVCIIHDRDKLGYNAAVEFLITMARDDQQRFEPTEDWDWRQNLHPATWLNQERWRDEAKARGQPVKPKFIRQSTAEALLDRAEELMHE